MFRKVSHLRFLLFETLSFSFRNHTNHFTNAHAHPMKRNPNEIIMTLCYKLPNISWMFAFNMLDIRILQSDLQRGEEIFENGLELLESQKLNLDRKLDVMKQSKWYHWIQEAPTISGLFRNRLFLPSCRLNHPIIHIKSHYPKLCCSV